MAIEFLAPDAPIEGLMADKIDDVILVRTDQVRVGERLRAVDKVWASALGDIMSREGQKTPIEICRLPGQTTWELVAGAHRHAGALASGIVHLRAIVVSADRADRRMREISENLWHRGLDPIDRAAFIAELVTLKRTAAGLDVAAHRTASVATRFKKRIDDEADETLETISNVYGWTDEVGAQIGLTGRSVRNDLMIFRGIAPSLIEALRGRRHPVATNATQLRALAKLEGAEQREVVFALLDERSPAKSVSEAVARLRGSNRAIDPEAKRLSTFIGTFGRMALTEKKGALSELRSLLPAGFKLVEGNERTPDERYQVELLATLNLAFEVLQRLDPDDGGEPVSDESIKAARAAVQLSLMAANAGAIPTPKGPEA